MTSVFKGKAKKSKVDPGQKTGIDPPTIRVEEARPEFPPEGSFHHKATEKLQNIFTMRSSNTRATSRGPSERGKSREYLPVLDTSANSNMGDQNRSVEMKRNDLCESLNTADRGMGSVDKAFEEVIVDVEDQCVKFPMAPQDSIQASKQQVRVMRTIGRGPFPERKLDKGKGRDNQAEGLGGAGGLGRYD